MIFMKRKLFTLLLASVVLMAFQANAQTSWWILADTTGLAENSGKTDKYPLNKKGLENWFTWTGEIKVHEAVLDQRGAIYDEGVNAKFKLEKVNGNNKLFRIRSEKSGEVLSKLWDTEAVVNFEVVQFNSTNRREAQELVNNKIEGYLAWPSSANNATSADSSQIVLLGVNKNDGKLSFKKFADWGAHFTKIPNNAYTSTQYSEGFLPGRLYLSNEVPYVQTYTKAVNGTTDSLLVKAYASGSIGNAINWGTSGTETAYTYFDLTFDNNHRLIPYGGGQSVGLDSLVKWFNSQGGWTTLDSVGTILKVVDRLYIVETTDKKLAVTAWQANGSWSNGEPQKFDQTVTTNGAKYYFFKTDQTHLPLLITRVGKALEDVLKYTVDLDPKTSQIERYLYKGNDDWRPIYVQAIPSCDPIPYEYVTSDWLAKNQYDIAAVTQKIIGTPDYSFTLNDANGHASAGTGNKAKFLFESAGKTGDISKTSLWSNNNIELFNIKNQEGKYLTILKESTFTNVLTPDSTITNLQLGWSTKLTNLDTHRQKFAIVRHKGTNAITLLPAASYKWIATPTLKYGGQIYYNDSIGSSIPNACGDLFVDLSKAWYITQLSKTGSTDQKLIIADPTSAQTSNEIIWLKIELDLNYGAIDCESFAVYNTKGEYYKQNSTVKGQATDAMINAHWTAKQIDKGADKGKWQFTAELDSLYPSQAKITQTKLVDKYIILKTDDDEILELVSGLKNPYTRDTVRITCVEHSSPFLDLSGFVGASKKIAILESLYQDRNVSYYTTDISKNEVDTVLYNNGTKMATLNSSIRKVTLGDNDSYSWVNVYQSNERYLGKNKTHKVPYFVFSYKAANGDEYFLSAIQGDVTPKDSVCWVQLTKTERETLLNYEDNYAAYPNFKFCLPYTDGEDHNNLDDQLTQPVYLQTLDQDVNTTYHFIKTSKESGLLNSEDVDKFLKDATSYKKAEGIYSLLDNYKKNLITFSSWVFIPDDVLGAEWLRVNRVVDAVSGDGKGVFTNVDNITAGTTFIAPGAPEGEVNYGVLTDINRDIVFTLAYKGEEKIGYEQTPIWYYNIIDEKSGEYLTDAADSTNAKYIYQYSTSPTATASFKYAFFTPEYSGGDKMYDAKFQQTFGLKLLEPDGTSFDFVIVSQADYGKKVPTYRYLGRVRERLVFVDRFEDALKLQWGTVEDDKYTGIDAVGAAGIYGVNGGVKVVNATGAIAIYSIDGRLIKSSDVVSPDQTIAVPAGIYIVKNGTSVVKVLVK
jgi:hypothetical protein